MDCSMPGSPVLHHLPEFAQIHVRWVGDALPPLFSVIPFSCCLQFFPATGSFPMSWLFPSGGQSTEASASASVLPMNIQGWFDLLAVQRTLKSLPQHHHSKETILQHSTIFIVQLSHPFMTTGKTIALTRWTFVGKVMSLLFNMLSRLVIAFPPRSKCLWIAWLQSPSSAILETPKIKSLRVFIVSPSGLNCWDQMLWSSFFECWLLSQLVYSSVYLLMPGWRKHKLESRFPREISITSYMQMTPHLWQKVKRN